MKMCLNGERRAWILRTQMVLSIVLIATAVAVAGPAQAQIVPNDAHVAQVSSPQRQMPSQTTPQGQTSGSSAPAESKPGGTRPTTPAPEPATPDADAQKAGAPTVLPPAPAEKTAPPINTK
jgi:hypothetical protein